MLGKLTYEELESRISDLEKADSKRKQAEAALRESEERFNRFLRNAPLPYQSLDENGNFLEVNQILQDVLGYTREELVGRNFGDFLHSDWVDHLKENFPRFKAVGEVLGVEFEMIKKDGTTLLVSFNGKIQRDAQNYFQCTHCIFQDITERRRAENSLRESENKLKSTLDATPFPVAVVDLKDDKIFYWSSSALKLFGHTAPTASEWYQIAYPDPDYRQEVIERWKPFLGKARESGQPVNTGEYRVTCKDGSERICELYATFIPDNLIVTFQDITERKQIQDEREATIEFLHFTNYSRGIEELIHAATAFIQKQSGCEAVGIRLKEENDYPYYETRGFPEEFVFAEKWLCARDEAGRPICDSTGSPVLECMCGNVISGRFDPSKPFFTAQGSFWTNCTTELLASTSVADRQSRTRNRCNGEGYESVALIPLQLGTECLGLLQLNDRSKGRFNLETIAMLERLANYLAVALAKFRAEEKLHTLNNELELRVEKRTRELQETQAQYLHAEKLSAIGKLSASIAHEVNNPLHAIMAILKGLKKHVILDKEDRNLLNLAIDESERIRNLMQSLRDFNRPSLGRKEVMDVHKSIDSMLLLCKNDFKMRQITVVCNYAEQLPQILTVQDQIKQVLLNLLTNAAEACLQPGGVITISTRLQEKWVAVAIKDTGIGIASDKLDQLFQPFYTTKAEVKGTGLGLSISYGIIQKHHGKIRVESNLGEGSTFTVLLPAQKNF